MRNSDSDQGQSVSRDPNPRPLHVQLEQRLFEILRDLRRDSLHTDLATLDAELEGLIGSQDSEAL